MPTRDDQGRRTVLQAYEADILSEKGKRIICRFVCVQPGMIAQLDLNSPGEVYQFIHKLVKHRRMTWPDYDPTTQFDNSF